MQITTSLNNESFPYSIFNETESPFEHVQNTSNYPTNNSNATQESSVAKYYPIIAAEMAASCLCLIFSIVVYSILPEFRNVHGKNLISMSSCMLSTYLLLILDLIIRKFISFQVCFTIAMLIHITFLATFFLDQCHGLRYMEDVDCHEGERRGQKQFQEVHEVRNLRLDSDCGGVIASSNLRGHRFGARRLQATVWCQTMLKVENHQEDDGHPQHKAGTRKIPPLPEAVPRDGHHLGDGVHPLGDGRPLPLRNRRHDDRPPRLLPFPHLRLQEAHPQGILPEDPTGQEELILNLHPHQQHPAHSLPQTRTKESSP
ncbi:g-protein coupled receptor Mth2 [Caerostris extrusa]|uniref:G-protein coupled receptor Mth2 n=1 Tax=Caerostris extrusa TaxID=172846 RepID=A0AAV4V7W8_CAEEX|nr:g-protein coupled receptor Mth2 [Caerostris extrusa]